MKYLIAIAVTLLALAAVAAMFTAVGPKNMSRTSPEPERKPGPGGPTGGAMKNYRRHTKRVLAALMAITAAAGLIATVSTALFTDSVPVGSNTFNTGTVDLTTSPTSAIWTAVTTGAPGDRATGTLAVTNAGSLELRYAVTGSNTNATLAAGMNLRIGLRGGASCDFPYHNTDGTTTTLTDDTQLFAGAESTAALIGSTTQGAQAGDRTLAASATENLCFAVVLPTTAANSLQGLNNTATFTFDAEQTANNP